MNESIASNSPQITLKQLIIYSYRLLNVNYRLLNANYMIEKLGFPLCSIGIGVLYIVIYNCWVLYGQKRLFIFDYYRLFSAVFENNSAI